MVERYPEGRCPEISELAAYLEGGLSEDKRRSIEEHAARMWENKYLPAVGPTRAGDQINVVHKLTGVLNELEHAHIYIQQLNDRIAVLEAELMKAD